MTDKTTFESDERPFGALMAATMQALLESSSDAVITLDAADRIVAFNPAAERLFGVRAAEALGGAVARFIPERYRERHEGMLRQFRLTGETRRQMGASRPITGLRTNGQEFPIEAWISRAHDGDAPLLTAVLRDVSGQRVIEDARLKLLVAREVEHRAKYALAAAQGLVNAVTADTKEDLTRPLQDRIAAFARGYSLLLRSAGRGVELRRLVDGTLEACAAPHQTRARGPDVQVEPEAAQSLGLILHELAANAQKHGALSREGGVVDLSWRIAPGPALELTWLETGGPDLTEPRRSREGFGSALLRELLVGQLKGEIALDWRATGLAAMLSLPAGMFRPGDAAPDAKPAKA